MKLYPARTWSSSTLLSITQKHSGRERHWLHVEDKPTDIRVTTCAASTAPLSNALPFLLSPTSLPNFRHCFARLKVTAAPASCGCLRILSHLRKPVLLLCHPRSSSAI